LSRLRQLAWFLALWLAGVAAMGLLGLLVRGVMPR
jgi:hypothetical protein